MNSLLAAQYVIGNLINQYKSISKIKALQRITRERIFLRKVRE